MASANTPSIEEAVSSLMTSKDVKKGKKRRRMHNPVTPYINRAPLKEKDQKSWLKFKKLCEEEPELYVVGHELATKGKNPIKLDHPFVPVAGNDAVRAFNKLYKMHVKKGNSNNLRHHEVMDCKWLMFPRAYCFYMTIEAIEEGTLGVYEAVVACNPSDGRRTLISFTLVDREPIGKIAMMLPHLIRLEFQYKTMKGMKKDIETKLETIHKSMEGKNKGKVAAEFIRLNKQHKAMTGICNLLNRQIRLQIPNTWNERSNPDGWSVPYKRTSGLQKRSDNAPCKGYNYYTPLLEFSLFGLY